MNNFNQLTPAETERLACLAEEMGEAIQVIGKILRHGYDSFSPKDPLQTTNRTLLERELGDVRYWMIEMCINDDLIKANIHAYADAKSIKVKPYLHHQEV